VELSSSGKGGGRDIIKLLRLFFFSSSGDLVDDAMPLGAGLQSVGEFALSVGCGLAA
jgi:hypothetical protein